MGVDDAPRLHCPEDPYGAISSASGASDVENEVPPASSELNRGSWRIAPAFALGGEWPGRPLDASHGAVAASLDEAGATPGVPALVPAPAVTLTSGDAAPVSRGRPSAPAFGNYPPTVLLPRCAE